MYDMKTISVRICTIKKGVRVIEENRRGYLVNEMIMIKDQVYI